MSSLSFYFIFCVYADTLRPKRCAHQLPVVNEDITTPGGHVRPAASLNPAMGSNVDGLSVMEKDPHQQSRPLRLMVIDMIWHKAPSVVYTQLHAYKHEETHH